VSVIRQSAIVFALGWLLAPLQFLTAVIVARSLGPEGKGIVALLAGLTAVVVSLTSLGITSGAAVLYKQKRLADGEILGSVLALTVASFVMVAALYLLLSETFARAFLGDTQLANAHQLWVALSLVMVIPSALLSVGDVLLIADDEMGKYALRSIGTALVGVALTWLLVLGFHMGITGVLISQPLAGLFGVALLWFWLARRGAMRDLRFSWAAARALLHIGLQQYGLALVALVAKRFDVFIIASLLSVQDAGYYSMAILIPNVLLNIPRATMWPLVASLSGGGSHSQIVFARASRVQVLLMLLLSAAVFPLAPILVDVAFGPAFMPAADPMRWALVGLCAVPVTIAVNAFLTARGRPGLSILSAAVGTGIQIALNFLLVPRWGVSGSAAALSANVVSTAAVQLVLARSERDVTLKTMLIPTREDAIAIWRAMSAMRPRWLRNIVGYEI
jgi:O-antigen/teichoic acid export membrane protein